LNNNRDNLETVQHRTYVSINHQQEVAYALSIDTKVGDLK